MKKVFLVILTCADKGEAKPFTQYVAGVFKSFDKAISYGDSLIEFYSKESDFVYNYLVSEYPVE